jgi:endonuclease/exonuclease/phosphatase family metal-dependent hydrolase
MTGEEHPKRRFGEADMHIRAATARIDGLRAAIADLQRSGQDVTKARQALIALQATLELMRGHRDGIADLPRTAGEQLLGSDAWDGQ